MKARLSICLLVVCASVAPLRSDETLPPFGRIALVDEIDAAGSGAAHRFVDSPVGASLVATVLGQACRVLASVSNESSHLVYRIGEGKGLKAGGHYVLAVEYPEDVARAMVVVNSGNEAMRGFHTGVAVGDALNAKYVSHRCESLDMPLSGEWQWWTLLIRLHDRFAEKGRAGSPSPRPLLPADGFDVAIAQFSSPNDPLSAGIAVRRIRLYEVLEPEGLALSVRLPPPGLPRRHLFWREEMSDGVIAAWPWRWTGSGTRRACHGSWGSTPTRRTCWSSALANIGTPRRTAATTGCSLTVR
jgi:hypothetical protein